MGSDGPIILTEQLSREFGHTRALRGVDLRVERGEIFGLVGPDGAGKTTIMRILAGILRPTSGRAFVDGISVTEAPERIKEQIAYMPQRFGLYEDLSVIENLHFYADLFRVPKKRRAERIERLFAFSRLGPFQDRAARALSGGMKQKLGLACALIHSPKLLLLDEPTNGVDPVSRRDFWKILHELLQEEISIFISTAYLDEADRTHRVGFMSNGSLIRHGEPRMIKELVRGAFFELVSSNAPAAKELLAGRSEVLDLNLFGEGIHMGLAREEDGPAVRGLLEEHGIEVYSMRRISPTMEDAFLALMSSRSQDRDAGEGGA